MVLRPDESFELVPLRSGLQSLRSITHGETFHPVTGPRVESRKLYVEQQRIVARWKNSTSPFVIWDVGFGAGANVTSAIEAFLDEFEMLGAELTNYPPIFIKSFDRTTGPIEFTLRNSEALDYIVPHKNHIETLLRSRSVSIRDKINWTLTLADFTQAIEDSTIPKPDSIFFDPYSPYKNPEMWCVELFSKLRACLPNERPAFLTNYTRSTSVRVTLLLAGFYVGYGSGIGDKEETTFASNFLESLERPLDQRWLDRLKVSRNSAPIRAGTIEKEVRIDADDMALILRHPQFCHLI
jgi:tRNA U34 5-methylaminomethyl-2-thiouridine-forming methyltransferase MnmC